MKHLALLLFTSLLNAQSEPLASLKNSTIKGDISVPYLSGNLENTPFNTLAFHPYLHYKSDASKFIQLGLSFESFHNLNSGSNKNSYNTYDSKNQSFEVLQESYLKLKDNRHELLIGRHNINSPLLNSNPMTLLKDSYEAYQYRYVVNAKLFLSIANIYKTRLNNSETFSKSTPNGSFENIYFLGIEDQSSLTFKSKFYYYYAKDLYNSWFIQADKYFHTNAYKYLVGALYKKTSKNHDSLNYTGTYQDSLIQGIRVGMKYEEYTFTISAENSSQGNSEIAYGGNTYSYTNSLLEKFENSRKPKKISLKFRHIIDHKFGKLISKILFKKVYQNRYQAYNGLYLSLNYKTKSEGSLHIEYEELKALLEKKESNRIIRAIYNIKI